MPANSEGNRVFSSANVNPATGASGLKAAKGLASMSAASLCLSAFDPSSSSSSPLLFDFFAGAFLFFASAFL